MGVSCCKMMSVLRALTLASAAVSILLSGCGAAGDPKILWQAGSPGKDGWRTASDGQCGAPSLDGDKFVFALQQSGMNCVRNQVQPTDATGDDYRLADGQQFTWMFHFKDGTASSRQGMGYDRDARGSIFQIHPYRGGDSCVGLDFFNGGVVGGPQQWLLTNCSGNVWTGPYTPGEEDDWKLIVLVSQGPNGHITLFRNGAQVANIAGATYKNTGTASGGPWWNFGPYKWRWGLPNAGGSTTSRVNATISGMTLTTP